MDNALMNMIKDENPQSSYYSNPDMQKVLVSSLELVKSINLKACGKCAPCRIGHVRMEEILRRMISMNGRDSDLDTLTSLAKALNETSLCSIGRKAPKHILTSLDILSTID